MFETPIGAGLHSLEKEQLCLQASGKSSKEDLGTSPWAQCHVHQP